MTVERRFGRRADDFPETQRHDVRGAVPDGARDFHALPVSLHEREDLDPPAVFRLRGDRLPQLRQQQIPGYTRTQKNRRRGATAASTRGRVSNRRRRIIANPSNAADAIDQRVDLQSAARMSASFERWGFRWRVSHQLACRERAMAIPRECDDF